MSPVIYQPHQCVTPALGDLPYESIWQCDTCQALWVVTAATRSKWAKIADPRREHLIEDASRRDPAQPPTVTPRMVQLVLDTYTEHSELGQDDSGDYAECAQCGTGSYGPHTIKAHAAEEATIALQGALAAREQR